MASIEQNWLIFGDSISAGLATSLGVKRTGNGKKKDGYGISQVGANPKKVLGFLKEWDVKAFDGKIVFLSTGYTNSSRQPEDAKKYIKQQLQLLKDANAVVAVMGVCKSYTRWDNGAEFPKSGANKIRDLKIPDGNAILEEIALAYSQYFIDGFSRSTDGLHPADYSLWWDTNFKNNIPQPNALKQETPNSDPNANANANGTNNGTVVNSNPSTLTDKANVSEEAGTKKEDVVEEPKKVVVPNPFTVVGTITIKKVSGPGDLIGVTVKTISNIDVNRGVEFSDISFSKDGDYEISVVSDNPDVEPLTFKISVGKEDEFIEQQPSGLEEPKEPKGKQPCIAQVHKPDVLIPPMEIELSGDGELDQNMVINTGIEPHVRVFGVDLKANDIMSMKLFHDGILPKCNVVFFDPQGILKTKTAMDDSIFEVFIDSRDPNLKSIHCQFKIEKFTRSEVSNNYTMAGTLHIPGGNLLYQQNYETLDGTSRDVLEYLCRKMGLGFNTNIDKADDFMRWVFCGSKTYEVMADIIDHSYVSEKSFMWGYIDYYYCFNYIDIEKELGRDITEDIGMETGNGKGDNKYLRITLTNDPSSNSSCFYYDEYDLRNNSTRKSLQTGYRTQVKYYDQFTKEMLIFEVDGNTSNESTNHILKGGTYDTGWYNNNVRTEFKGTIDTSNVHKNYYYAPVLNKRNLDDLLKITLSINMPHMNLNLYKGMKVNSEMSNLSPNPQDPADINFALSGSWIISDINYLKTSKGFQQKVILVRRELGKTPEEAKEVIAPKPAVVEETVNPEPIKMNAEYVVGETYAFNAEDGKTYFVVVKSKSDDGKNVTGIIKQASPKEVFYEEDNYDALDEEYVEQSATTGDGEFFDFQSDPLWVEDTKAAEAEAANLPPVSDPNEPLASANPSGIAGNESWGGTGYPCAAGTTEFVNKYCNGVYPARQHPDGTFVIIGGVKKVYPSGHKKAGQFNPYTRHMLSENPEYIRLMVSIELPLSDDKNGKPRSTTLRVHPKFAKALKPALAEIKAANLHQAIKSTGGALCVRNVTGGIRLTNHSYGMALDLNPDQIGYNFNDKWDLANEKVYSCIIPWNRSEGFNVRSFNEMDRQYLEISKIMSKYGIGWLSDHDPMHFCIYEVSGKNGI